MAEHRRSTFVRCLALVACTNLVQGQLQFKQTVDELIASGKLQNATQTAAGYTAQTLCSGEFTSHRSFGSVWDNDACMFNCLTHTIFNRSDPQHAYGKFFVDSADKLVNVSVINSSTSAVYTGDRFGCQLSLVNETRVVPTFMSDERRGASSEWKDATMNSTGAISGVDYATLNATLARYFENATLVELAKTQAIVVIYKSHLIAEKYSEAMDINASTPLVSWRLAKSTASALQVYKGQLIAEMYSKAMDINASTSLVSWSLAKSVTSAVVGVRSGDPQMEMGFSPYQLASTPVWNASEVAARNITVDDLMRMVSGIDWNEAAAVDASKGVPANTVGEMLYEAQDAAAFVGGLPQNATPGMYFNYSTGNYQVVQYNLRESFGGNDLHYWSYAYNKIFKRIGATSFSFQADPSGTLLGGSSAYMTPRDWARFGQLYLQDGVWNGEQILPKGWVQYSTTPTEAFGGYGSGWWLGFPGAPDGTFYGNGLLGQRVIVVPAMDLVIVRNGFNFLNDFDQVYGKDFFTDIASCIPAKAAPKQQVMVAKGMAQEVEFALGDSLAADVDTSSQV